MGKGHHMRFIEFVNVCDTDSYPVFVAEFPIIGADGKSKAHRIRHGVRMILISPLIPVADRDKAIALAAAHATKTYPISLQAVPFVGGVE